jgi:Fur family ferric uptake transcriptional regulator
MTAPRRPASTQELRGNPPARRETRQRVAVAAALCEVTEFVSAQQLHAILREHGETVGLATVYRTLQQLAADGEVDVLHPKDGAAVYRRCSSGHHHHLICRCCRRTIEVNSITIERWAQRIAEQNGFADVEHVIEMFGTCTTCAAPPRDHVIRGDHVIRSTP